MSHVDVEIPHVFHNLNGVSTAQVNTARNTVL